MEGFGIDKLLLILVIVLVLFGARRIPEIAASVGKGIREFKRGMHDIDHDSEVTAPAPSRIGEQAPPAETSPAASPEPKRLLRG